MAQGFSRADQPIRALQRVPRDPAPPADPAQLGLLDTPAPPVVGTTLPRARNTDRATSHEASKAATRGLTGKQRAVLGMFLQFGAMHDEALVDIYREERQRQLALGFGPLVPDLTDSSIRSRRNELVTLGHIADSERQTVTRRGGKTTIWQVTAKGLTAPAPDTLSPRETPPDATER